MFAGFGSWVARFRWPVLAVALVAVVSAGVWGLGVFGQVSEGGYNDPNSESSRAAEAVTEAFGAQGGDLVVIYTPTKGKIDDAALGKRVRERLAALPKSAVTSSTSYWQTRSAQYAAKDKSSAVAVVNLAGADDGAKLDAYREIDDKFAVDGATVQVAGATVLADASTSRSSSDLAIAEAISLPITLILLLFIFGSLVAAALPVLVGGAAVLGSLGILHAIASHHEVNSFAVNVASLLGLGMAIDYGLFMVGRFREEQAAGRTPFEAVQRTVATAGRTVLFSASLLMIALAGLLLFPQGFLNSLAYGGLAAVGLAALLSLTLLPALLAVLGPRVDKIPVRLPFAAGSDSDKSVWARLAGGVLRRPVVVAVPILAGLLLLALPIGGVRFGEADERTLPPGDSARQAIETMQAGYPQFAGDGVQIVLRGRGDTSSFAVRLRQIPGISQLTPAQRAKDTTVFTATLKSADPFSTEARDVVDSIRALPVPGGVDLLVGGTTARNIDSLQATAAKLPLMIGLLVGATLILMFLAFGSILLPIKAVLMSALSLSATFGILVWIFQDGHGASLLNVTPAPLEAGIVVLMAAVVFGLSTDYEVFLLSRMVEARAHGATTKEAVTVGLSRTGRVISAAALLLIVVTGAFALSSVTTMRFVGVGMIIALLLDATVVRMLLVPAVMGLLGDAAWWAPGPLRRLQQRAGLSEHAGEQKAKALSSGRHAATDDTQVLALPPGPSWVRPFFEEPKVLPAASSPHALPAGLPSDPAATQVIPRITDDEPIDAEIIPDTPEPASATSATSGEADATAVVADLASSGAQASSPDDVAGVDDRTAAYPVIKADSTTTAEPSAPADDPTSAENPAAEASSSDAAVSSAASSSLASDAAVSSASDAAASSDLADLAPAAEDERDADSPTPDEHDPDEPTSDQRISDDPTSDQRISDDPTSDQRISDDPTSDQRISDDLTSEERDSDGLASDERADDERAAGQTDQSVVTEPAGDEAALVASAPDAAETKLVEAAAAEAVRAGIERAQAEMAEDEAAYSHQPISVESSIDPVDDIIDAEIVDPDEDDDLPRGTVYPSSTQFFQSPEPARGSTYSSSNYTDWSAPDDFFFSSPTSTFTSAFALPAEPEPVDTAAPTPYFGDRPEAPTFFREPLALPPIPPAARDLAETNFEQTRDLSSLARTNSTPAHPETPAPAFPEPASAAPAFAEPAPADPAAVSAAPTSAEPAPGDEPSLDATRRFDAPDLDATTRFTAPDLATTRHLPAPLVREEHPAPAAETPTPPPAEPTQLPKRPLAADLEHFSEPEPEPERSPTAGPSLTAPPTTPAPAPADPLPRRRSLPDGDPFRPTQPEPLPQRASQPEPLPQRASQPEPLPQRASHPEPLIQRRPEPGPLPQRAFETDPLPQRTPLAEPFPTEAATEPANPLPQRTSLSEPAEAAPAPIDSLPRRTPAADPAPAPVSPLPQRTPPADSPRPLAAEATPAETRREPLVQPDPFRAHPEPLAPSTFTPDPLPRRQPVAETDPFRANVDRPLAQPDPATPRGLPALPVSRGDRPTDLSSYLPVRRGEIPAQRRPDEPIPPAARRPASLADQPLPHRSGRNETGFPEPETPRALPAAPTRRPADLGDHLRETRPADLAQYSRTHPPATRPQPPAADEPPAQRRPETLAEAKPARRPATLADQLRTRPTGAADDSEPAS
ncbi:efflux RND transporter permease subunit [Actinoplanes sp. NPDC049596]|uniref:efflux RND transporter permease subunit n=1 Tax=unclassified Actinoplanes TaxID=2626549 RepID=UPI00341D3E70